MVVGNLALCASILIGAWADTVCYVRHPVDLANKTNCDVLNLDTYKNDSLPVDPRLFDYISKFKVYEKFMLRHSELEKFTDQDEIRLKPGTILSITENFKLLKLPKFVWDDGARIFITIKDNHKLDTTEIREMLESKHIGNADVQHPFACGFTRKSSSQCKIIEGTLTIGDSINDNLDNLEEIYGQIEVHNYPRATLPAMPKLRKLEWTKEGSKDAAIKIYDNDQLTSIAELFKLDNIVLGSTNKAIMIKNNSLLCIEPENVDRPFVKKYAQNVRICGSEGAAHGLSHTADGLPEQAAISNISSSNTGLLCAIVAIVITLLV
ncbi:unnamed protein product [Cylicocyclus nassatus]|uniref:Receptor L-domain domain-containing protein n=1 Tax=Cylicocyclus nassatus TaxID=53992 RepID=A0AA36DMV2_CYLNA|nr:unnamed protein product [Cylicocyclus nassatus]